MNELWLLVSLLALSLLVFGFLLAPLKKKGLIILPIFLSLAGLGYLLWGGFPLWQHEIRQQAAEVRAINMLKRIKTPEALIAALRKQLDLRPESAKGWYLLGRLYSNHNGRQQALDAFAKAYLLAPKNEQFAVYYGLALWEHHQRQFTQEILTIFQDLLAQNPKQPDALAMLAMHAFFNHHPKEAIRYWRRLLVLTQPHSNAALTIQKAIARAEGQIRFVPN
jgi:cytochrome c-type biogenesis protein CcmH